MFELFGSFYLKFKNSKDNILVYPGPKKIKKRKYDKIFLPDFIGKSEDYQPEFQSFRKLISDQGTLVITSINPIWGKLFGYKNPKTPLLYLWFIENLLEISNFKVTKSGYFVIPPKIPILSGIFNAVIPRIPKLKRLLPYEYVIAKPEKILPTKKYSVSVVIPVHNEEGNVADCIKQVPKMGKFTEIIIVDDGSTDNTLKIAKSFQKKFKNLKIFSHKPNRGKVWAVKRGFDEARGDILMIWDADRTVLASELPRFYDLMASGQAEYVQGTRLAYPMEKQAMKVANLFGNLFFGWLYSFIMSTRITDTLCGTKVILKKDYKKIKFGTEPWGDFDLLFGAKKLGLKIKEIPIHYKARVAGLSKMKTFKYGMVVSKMSLVGLWEFKLKNILTKNPLLLLILLLAFGVRFTGLLPNLPYHPDEGAIQQTSHKLFLSIITEGNFEPDSYKYGSIVFYIQALSFLPLLIWTYILKLLSFLSDNSSFSHLTFIENFEAIVHEFGEILFWLQRSTTALFGSLSVVIVYILTKKLFTKPIALTAAFLFAIAPSHVRNSHWVTTDVLSLFTVLLALLFMVEILRTGKWKWYILTGIAIGISCSVRYFPIALLAYPIAALLDTTKNRFWLIKVITGLILIPAGFIISTPYLLFNSHSQAVFQKDMADWVMPYYGSTVSTYAQALAGFILSMGKSQIPEISTLIPSKFYPYYSQSLVFDGLGPIATSLALLGAVVAFFKYPKQFLFITIIPLFNWFYISFYLHAAYDRLTIPLLPFLSIYTGVLIVFIWDITREKLPFLTSITLVVIALLAASYYPFKESVTSSIDCSRPTVFKETELWIDKNISSDARIAHIPIFMYPSKEFPNLKETQPNGIFFPEELRAENYEYMFMNSTRFGYNLYPFYTDFFIRPEDMFQNTYINLALLNYKTQTEEKLITKRAKFCDPTELMIYRIPEITVPTDKQVTGFEFSDEKGFATWHIQKFNEKNIIKASINNEEGYLKPGALEISWENIAYLGPRVYSERIPVEPNKQYSLVGWIKSSTALNPPERDGFLRIDFYKSGQDIKLPGESVILSKRSFGEPTWNKVSLTGRSPSGASFAIISAQVSGTKTSGSFYFDDLELLSE